MSIDLEKFPWSDAAQRMLTYVTKGWYDKSYVGKWLYEVMGREIDTATSYIEELPDQLFVDTATWGLRYHEIKYGLAVREDLTYEERRRLIREKRDTKAPMTPWRMEQILKGITDYDVEVHDINEAGHNFSHPNRFSVRLEGEPELNIGDIIRKVDKLKQSHTVYDLYLLLMVIENPEKFQPKIHFKSDFAWWEWGLDGTYKLDGSTTLDHWYPTKFFLTYPYSVKTEEEYGLKMAYQLPDFDNQNILLQTIRIQTPFVWWAGALDGGYSLNGSLLLNNWYPTRFRCAHRLSVPLSEAFDGKAYYLLPEMDNTAEVHYMSTHRMVFGWRDGAVILDGLNNFDGTISLDNGEPPYLQTIRIRAPVEHQEEVSMIMYIPSLAGTFNGEQLLDGTIKLNSGREEL